MQLADSKKIDDVFVKIIQQFDLGCLFMEEHLGAAAKWFDITGVFGNQGNDFTGDTVLAAQVCKWSNHWLKIVKVDMSETATTILSSAPTFLTAAYFGYA